MASSFFSRMTGDENSSQVQRNLVFNLLCVLCLLTMVGCGSGGGDGSPTATTTPFEPGPGALKVDVPALAPGKITPSIAFSQNQVVINFNQAVSGSIREEASSVNEQGASVKAAGSTRRFGLIVTTGKTDGGSFSLWGNRGKDGGGVVLNSIHPAVSTSLRATAFPNQARVDAIRNKRWHENILAGRSGAGTTGVSANIRAASNAGEKVGDIANFSMYSSSNIFSNSSYVNRTAVLRRKGTFCKIFVDPEPYQGLSAVTGPFTITDEDLRIMEEKFDQVIYKLITQNYGPTRDVDSDGCISIVLSPLITQLGFAGLFDTEHLEKKGPLHPISNERDMISVFTPDANFNGTNWRAVALETTTHEFQHMANYVAHRFIQHSPDQEPQTSWEESVWLDEALAVGAEARYRITIGDPAGEDRFRDFARSTRNTSLNNFSSSLANYGAGGLFTHYIFDRLGTDTIRSIVNSDWKGIDNIDHAGSTAGGFQGLFRDWSIAMFAESHKLLFDVSQLDAVYRYKNDLAIDLSKLTTGVSNLAAFQTTMLPTSMAFAIIEVPVGATGKAAQLVLEDPDGGSMSARLIRLD
ncbi:MAG: hypothetical protein WA705_24875 [Candidatus Ozemobacteraceae bacterium]